MLACLLEIQSVGSSSGISEICGCSKCSGVRNRYHSLQVTAQRHPDDLRELLGLVGTADSPFRTANLARSGSATCGTLSKDAAFGSPGPTELPHLRQLVWDHAIKRDEERRMNASFAEFTRIFSKLSEEPSACGALGVKTGG